MNITMMLLAAAVIPAPREMTINEGEFRWRGKDISKVIERISDPSLPPEGYRLEVTTNRITVASSGDAGAFYAVKTLEQFADRVYVPDPLKAEIKLHASDWKIPCAVIKDWPEFRWRGLLLDEARHFLGKETVLRQLDLMAKYKLNVFHWHLVDDQGWRLELKRHPELVQYGSVRPRSVKFGGKAEWIGEKQTLHYDLNTEKYGPFYYTQEDVKEICAYAKRLNITVVPEIEVPGHERALLAARPDLSCRGEGALERVPRIFWSIEKDVLCAGNDETISYLESVFEEVCELFPDSPYIHIGGDECPKTRWEKCPKCQKRMREIGAKDERQLQAWMTRHFSRFLEAKGRRAVGWDEVLIGDDVPASVIGMNWRNNVNRGVGDGVVSAAEAIRRGHDLIMTPNNFCYFSARPGLPDDPYPYYDNMPYAEEKPRKSFLTLRKAYSFDPYAGIAEEHRNRILGVQACIWGEAIFTRFDLEWKAWPRTCALAEIAWLGPRPRGWEDFHARVTAHRPHLIAGNVNCSPIMPLEKPEKSFSPDRPRSELLKHFTENVFGKRPVERPPELKFERIAPDEEILGGLGIKRRMKFVYGNGRGKSGEARFTAYIPRKKGRHPSFLLIAPHDPDTIGERVSAKRAARMPVKELLLRGFAGISYKNDDCAADYVAVSPVKYDYTPGYAMTNGVWDVFGPTGAERTETSWGAISAWAWGASRVMDWIETQPELDAGRVAVVGLSRCGKTALWAGASDTRFALTVSCCSGCGGAKMNRLDLPHSEHIANLAEVFPHWFSKAFYRYSGRDAEVPVDMDGLIALCAPRRVLVCSASEDAWAGPYGEYMSAKLASSAWERYGLKGLVGEFPPPGKPLQEGRIAYHVRPGPHLQTVYDWNRYMDFFTPDETLSARD